MIAAPHFFDPTAMMAHTVAPEPIKGGVHVQINSNSIRGDHEKPLFPRFLFWQEDAEGLNRPDCFQLFSKNKPL